MQTVIPMIDGGTEGFKGNARVLYPRLTACVDCTLNLFPPQVLVAYNTIQYLIRLIFQCVQSPIRPACRNTASNMLK